MPDLEVVVDDGWMDSFGKSFEDSGLWRVDHLPVELLRYPWEYLAGVKSLVLQLWKLAPPALVYCLPILYSTVN